MHTYAIRMCFFGIALLFGPCLSGWMLRLEFEVLTMNSWTFARLHLEAATHAFSINLSHLVLSNSVSRSQGEWTHKNATSAG